MRAGNDKTAANNVAVRNASCEGAVMTEVTPEQQALYALARGFHRNGLSLAAQLEYDRLRPAWERGEFTDWVPSSSLEQALRGQVLDAGEQHTSNAIRHTVDPSGTTHTFRLHRGRNRVLGIICLAIAACFPVGLGAQVAAGQLTAWDVILFIGCALFFGWGGICAFRKGVHVSAGKLAIGNELGTRTFNASEIRAITLEPKAVSEVATHWVARVELTNGRKIWVEAFDGGPARRPPRPEIAGIVDEVRALLGIRADDISAPESH